MRASRTRQRATRSNRCTSAPRRRPELNVTRSAPSRSPSTGCGARRRSARSSRKWSSTNGCSPRRCSPGGEAALSGLSGSAIRHSHVRIAQAPAAASHSLLPAPRASPRGRNRSAAGFPSTELKLRLVEAYLNGEGSLKRIAKDQAPRVNRHPRCGRGDERRVDGRAELLHSTRRVKCADGGWNGGGLHSARTDSDSGGRISARSARTLTSISWIASFPPILRGKRPAGRPARRHVPLPWPGFPPSCGAWSGPGHRGTG